MCATSERGSMVRLRGDDWMRVFKCALMMVVLGACLPLARADDIPWGLNPNLNDTIFLGLGALYTAKSSTTAQLNSQKLGVGTIVDFQNTLGLGDTAWGPNVEFRWRMSERWRLEVSYFWLSLSGSKSIDQDIQWGDVVYPVNAQVNSKVNFTDLRASVGYSFYKTSDKELGVGLGLHTLGYWASLRSQTQGTEGTIAFAPLPVLSLYGGFALNEQWSVGGRLDWFSLTYQQYHGGITVLGLNLLYQPFRHVGFGVGYTGLFLNFSATSTGLGSFQGKLTQNLQGPTFYVTASF
jgi:hypothetical protein